MEKTMEQKVAESILQQPETVMIGGKYYTIAKPSTATLIMASAAISKLPHFEIGDETTKKDVLQLAKDAEGVGEVVAIMMLGAKGLNRKGARRWIKLFRIKRMKRIVLEGLTTAELLSLSAKLFEGLGVTDFFRLIAFLGDVNITKPTKATTTASGQQ